MSTLCHWVTAVYHVGWSFGELRGELGASWCCEVLCDSSFLKMSILGESALLSDRQSLSSSISLESFNKCEEDELSVNLDEVDGASVSRFAASSSLFVFLHFARRFLNHTFNKRIEISFSL